MLARAPDVIKTGQIVVTISVTDHGIPINMNQNLPAVIDLSLVTGKGEAIGLALIVGKLSKEPVSPEASWFPYHIR